MTESNLTWFDGLLKKGAVPYPIISIILGVVIYSIFLIFGVLMNMEWYVEEKIGFMLMGILIAYQLSGIQYLLDKFKKIMSDICLLGNASEEDFFIGVKSSFGGSMWYYALLIIVILPFYLTDFISSDYSLKENYSIIEQFLPNYIEEPSFWILTYDIYWDLLGFLALILFAYILWIIINITWTLKTANHNFHAIPSNANIFSISTILKPIKSSILKILFFYFICISLLILSYGLAGYIFEKIILSILLLIGLIFFFMGYESLHDIVRRQVIFETNQINLKSREYTLKLLAIDLDGNYDSKIQETNFISNMLDVLQKQRELLMKANTRIYDAKSIVSIVSAFLLPIIADFAKNNIIFLLESGEISHQGISLLNSLLNKII